MKTIIELASGLFCSVLVSSVGLFFLLYGEPKQKLIGLLIFIPGFTYGLLASFRFGNILRVVRLRRKEAKQLTVLNVVKEN
jgi:hypothetical protein